MFGIQRPKAIFLTSQFYVGLNIAFAVLEGQDSETTWNCGTPPEEKDAITNYEAVSLAYKVSYLSNAAEVFRLFSHCTPS